MSNPVVWRVEARALPRLARRCARCGRGAGLEPTGRFRVNAQGRRLDVWLLYRCTACGAPARDCIVRRAAVDALGTDLQRFERSAPELVWHFAFAARDALPVPHRVVRPPIPWNAPLHARIEQPYPCGVRWDRLLADAFASRNAVRRALRDGRLRIQGVRSLAQHVRDGQCFTLASHDAARP